MGKQSVTSELVEENARSRSVKRKYWTSTWEHPCSSIENALMPLLRGKMQTYTRHVYPRLVRPFFPRYFSRYPLLALEQYQFFCGPKSIVRRLVCFLWIELLTLINESYFYSCDVKRYNSMSAFLKYWCFEFASILHFGIAFYYIFSLNWKNYFNAFSFC